MNNYFETRKKRKQFDGKCGDVYGRLTLTGVTYTKMIYNHWVRFVEVVCQCGAVKELPFDRIASGATQSCGCYRVDKARAAKLTHGLTDHLLYDVWTKMCLRCNDTQDKGFKNYGGRGIEVWKDWNEDFMTFFNWCISNGYEEGLSLDRTNNDGNYSPQNCRFVTPAEQNRNRRSNRMFTAFGETKCLFDWGADSRCVVGVWTLRGRMDKDYWQGRIEEAMTIKNDRERSCKTNKRAKQLTAFGETKHLTDWSKDKRCVVGFDRLRDRIAWGWDHTEAITTVQKDSKEINLTAFGETKSFTNWLKDDRCVVRRDALRDRFRKGWKHEDCITVPSKTKSGSSEKKGLILQ
jgi:hypothetical protein